MKLQCRKNRSREMERGEVRVFSSFLLVRQKKEYVFDRNGTG